MLVNCGNFSNVQVEVEMIKEIAEDKDYFTNYTKLSNLLDATLMKELIGPTNELTSLLKIGAEKYMSQLETNEKILNDAIKENV